MTSNLTLEKRLQAFKELGQFLESGDERLQELVDSAHQHNSWFTRQETNRAVTAIGRMLNEPDLDSWLSANELRTVTPKKIGLVLAGNIPLVGFHDILCVLVAGHVAVIKQSSQDQKLIPYILSKLVSIEPALSELIVFTERLQDYDAVIATGSNNSSRYFEHYFSKVPHIIRKNRNSVAVLSGNEPPELLRKLGHDIFDYFGLGCRNVSKLYVPRGYAPDPFFEGIEPFKNVIDHHKYSNNYDYNKSIYLINLVKHFDNGFLLLKEDDKLASPLAVMYYQEYQNLPSLEAELSSITDQIQCIVTAQPLSVPNQQVSFGDSQSPKLWDYADGVNTIEFLSEL